MVEDTRVFGVSKTARVERKTMEKTEFTYQKFNLRIGISVLILPIVQIIRIMILRPLGISEGLYIAMGAMITVGGLMLYYKRSEKLNFFFRKGCYWEENGTVCIQRGKKVKQITDVDWLRGTNTFAYGLRVAMLVVQCGRQKTILFSRSLEEEMEFSSTELYPLYQLILKNNPKLEKDENLPYWYERKKEC